MKKLSVLVVEDSPLFRAALSNVLCACKRLHFAICTSRLFLRRAAKIHQDAVLIDTVTWTAHPDALVDVVKRISMCTPVVLLGRDDMVDAHITALRAGAAGFVGQTATPEMLLRVIKAVAGGRVWFGSRLFQSVFVKPPVADQWSQDLHLQKRQKEILNLVAHGKSNKEIGTYFGLSERTIKAHVSNLFLQTRVPNRSGLVRYAVKHGLTD